jgi:hypothetical protein
MQLSHTYICKYHYVQLYINSQYVNTSTNTNMHKQPQCASVADPDPDWILNQELQNDPQK